MLWSLVARAFYMSISLTERAAKHIRGSLEKRGKGIGIRLGVKTAGCSGLAYKLEFVDTPTVISNI